MRNLSQIYESTIRLIDDQWINDDKPVCTRDGRKVYIMGIDMSQVPNVLKGAVSMNGRTFDFEWYDTGECKYAVDNIGNPCRPSEKDDLCKDM